MSDPSSPTALVTAAVNPPGLPDAFSIPAMGALARDLAIQMYERPAILRKHNLTEAQCAALEKHPYFVKMLEHAVNEWNSPRTVTERLALEAAHGLETALPDVIARMSVKNEPLTSVVAAGQLLTKISGAGEQKQQAAPGEKFTIVIDLGGDKQVFEKTRPAVIEGYAVQSFAEGASTLLDLRTEPETPRSPAPIQPDPEGAGDASAGDASAVEFNPITETE
jgi:hypothetical protein